MFSISQAVLLEKPTARTPLHSNLRCSAAELLGRGFHLWEKYVDIPQVGRQFVVCHNVIVTLDRNQMYIECIKKELYTMSCTKPLRLLYFTQIFIYFSKPLRLLYSLIIYEIVNFSFFTLYSLLLLSFFLYLKSVPIYVIVHVHCTCT